MDTYDLQTPDSYAVHLAELNTSKGVTASRDILNTDGTLLVAKGHPIKAETVQRLLNHKLTQPLETSIDVADAISPQQLFDDITSMLRGDKECLAIHQALDLDEQLRKQCQLYGTFPLVTQKMTVLSSRLPHEYAKATFCAWFCLVLAVQMGNDGRGEAFLAGLTHDTGLLHIDPAIVNKTGSYTPEEWRALQSHTLVADMFLSFVDGLPKTVRRAVREHHEQADGTGYPAGLFGDKLGSLGQIVAMADTVWGICRKPQGRKTQTLVDVGVIIKLNTSQQPGPVDSALYHLLRPISHAERPLPVASRQNAGLPLDELGQKLWSDFQLLMQLRGMLSATHTDKLVRSASFKLERLLFVVNGSGLLSESVTQWLKSTNGPDSLLSQLDVYELSLMYGELQWQMAQLIRTLQQVLQFASGLDAQGKTALLTVLHSLGGVADQGDHDRSIMAI